MAASAAVDNYVGSDRFGWGYLANKAIWHNKGKMRSYGELFRQGDTIGVVLDMDNGTLSFCRNGKDLGVAVEGLIGEVYPAFSLYNQDDQLSLESESRRSGQRFPNPSVSALALHDGTKNSSVLSNSGSMANRILRELELVTHTMDHLASGSGISVSFIRSAKEFVSKWRSNEQQRIETMNGEIKMVDRSASACRSFGFAPDDCVRTPKGDVQILGVADGMMWWKYLNDSSQQSQILGNSAASAGTRASSWTRKSARELRAGQGSAYLLKGGLSRNIVQTSSSLAVSDMDVSDDSLRSWFEIHKFDRQTDSELIQLVNNFKKIGKKLSPNPWNFDFHQIMDTLMDENSKVLINAAERSQHNTGEVVSKISKSATSDHEVDSLYATAGETKGTNTPEAILSQSELLMNRLGILLYLNHILDLVLPLVEFWQSGSCLTASGWSPLAAAGAAASGWSAPDWSCGAAWIQARSLILSEVKFRALQKMLTQTANDHQSASPETNSAELISASAKPSVQAENAKKRPSITLVIQEKGTNGMHDLLVNTARDFRRSFDESIFGQLFGQLWNCDPAIFRCSTDRIEPSLLVSLKLRSQASKETNSISCQLPETRSLEAESFAVENAFQDLISKLNVFKSFQCDGSQDHEYFIPTMLSIQPALMREIYQFMGRLMGFALRAGLTFPVKLAPFLWEIILNPSTCSIFCKENQESSTNNMRRFPVFQKLRHSENNLKQVGFEFFIRAALHMRSGFLDVIPGHMLALFEPREMITLLSS